MLKKDLQAKNDTLQRCNRELLDKVSDLKYELRKDAEKLKTAEEEVQHLRDKVKRVKEAIETTVEILYPEQELPFIDNRLPYYSNEPTCTPPAVDSQDLLAFRHIYKLLLR